MVEEKIEILSVDYLTTHRELVEEFREVARCLKWGLGWHYLLDLSWAASHLSVKPGAIILDAGAGIGLMQWWLAEQGVNVVSVDSISRANLHARFRERYRVKAWQPGHLSREDVGVRDFLPTLSPRLWPDYPRQFIAAFRKLTQNRAIPAHWGTVYIYNRDLSQLDGIKSNSMDAVVSISALEHNAPENLSACLVELMRVLKPGGKLITTLATAKEQDWFHEPSQGWCYTETTLRDFFDLPADCPSSYDRYDELLEALRNCSELRDNLADFYFKSGNNGMPWGIWDPKYQPVGVVRVKERE